MKMRYDAEKLWQITKDIYVLTGITVTFLDADLDRICVQSDETDFCGSMYWHSGAEERHAHKQRSAGHGTICDEIWLAVPTV